MSLEQRLEAFEQRVDRRFEGLEQRLETFEQRVDRRFEGLDEKVTRSFVWLVGIQVTTLAAVVAALVGR